jgi:hypothetical protein
MAIRWALGGETLVIETTNFKRWALEDYFYTNPKEFRMHSDALRTVERLHWKSKDALAYELTIDDPKIFARPWSQELRLRPSRNGSRRGCMSMFARRTIAAPVVSAR